MNSTHVRTGRKPKGNRKPVSAMLPVEAVDLADAMAKDYGVDRTAMIGRLLCERLDIPVPAYCLPPATNQQELPVNKAS